MTSYLFRHWEGGDGGLGGIGGKGKGKEGKEGRRHTQLFSWIDANVTYRHALQVV